MFRGGEVVGTLYDSDILKARAAGLRRRSTSRSRSLMAEPLPVVRERRAGRTRVTRLLAARNPAVLVRENGAVIGILTRFDMLQFIAGGE